MKKKVLLMALGLMFLSGCQLIEKNEKVEGEKGETKQSEQVTEVAQEELAVQSIERSVFDGYWGNDHYTLYIGDAALYIQNHQNNYVHSYDFTDDAVEENVLSLSLKELREENSISLLEENSQLTLTFEDEMVYLSDVNLEDNAFTIIAETDVHERFAGFVETDGAVGQLAYQGPDLSLEDFKGHWVPMDKYHLSDDKLTPLGNYDFWIGDKFMAIGYYASFFDTFYIHDYEIIGNTLTVVEELLDSDEVRSVEGGYIDSIQREKIKTQYVLYQEEDRDRLIPLSGGPVLQRATDQEIIDNFGYTNEDKYTEVGGSLIYSLNSLNENQYEFTESTDVDESIRPENYPYSIGELSEATLYKEKQIIEGQIDHPEQGINEVEAIAILFSGSYESTPSYQNLDYLDEGYYFKPFREGTIMTFGYGGRTHWSSGPLTLDVENAVLEDNIFKLSYTNGETQEFYRISDDVIYARDNDGNFTRRYAQGTNWNDFHNLSK